MRLLEPQTRLTLFTDDPVKSLDLKNPFLVHTSLHISETNAACCLFLYQGFSKVRDRIGKDKLVVFDGFAGSGAAARLLKAFASKLHVNDLEDYAETINRAYLNKSIGC